MRYYYLLLMIVQYFIKTAQNIIPFNAYHLETGAVIFTTYTKPNSSQYWQYEILFQNGYENVPVFAFSMMYYGSYYIANRNLQNMLGSLTPTYAIISSNCWNIQVILFRICYIALVDCPAFAVEYVSVQNVSTISNSNYSYYSVNSSRITFSSLQILSLPMITGFYFMGSSVVGINISVGIVSLSTYNYQIDTIQNCTIAMVSFYILFCNSQSLLSDNATIVGGQFFFTFSQVTVYNYLQQTGLQTHILVGLRGFYSILSAQFIFGCVSFTPSNNKVPLRFFNFGTPVIYYSYLSITFSKLYQTTPNCNIIGINGSLSASSVENINYLTIILAAISATLILCIIFGVVIWKKMKKYGVIPIQLKLPSKDDLRQSPSINF